MHNDECFRNYALFCHCHDDISLALYLSVFIANKDVNKRL